MKFELRLEPARAQRPLAEAAYARWRSTEGDVTVSFHRTANGYLVRFIDRADFAVELDDRLVTCWPLPGRSSSALHDLYLNQVEPMIRGHQGELVLHASGAAIHGAAAAFVALTGRGKSTLAAAFARAGMPFLSDDGLALTAEGGSYLASPNRPSFRLWRDSEAVVIRSETEPEACEEEKSRVDAGGTLPFQDKPLVLRSLYFLGPGESDCVSIAKLPVRQALAELINHSFFLDADDAERMKRHFESLARLAEAVPSYELDYPRQYDQLPCVMAALSKHMDDRGSIT